MLQRTLVPAIRRPGRPSPPPPAILRSPGETLEGSDLLGEVGGGPGVLLWRALRSATLWVAAGPRERGHLFASGAHERWLRDGASMSLHPRLSDPLNVLGSLLASAGAATPERVARACAEVAEWAVEAGAPRTALAFSQAAAAASPESPPAALAAGLLAETVGQEIRAETWLRRALVLARARRDRTTQAHASLHLAGILARRGERARAARMYARTLRLARRRSLRSVRAQALREVDALAGRSAPAADERRVAGA
jgi:tetratricopeptide (TPR) repeat protein